MDGRLICHGLLFLRKADDIKSVKDMFAFVNKTTIAGYLLPARYFLRAGN